MKLLANSLALSFSPSSLLSFFNLSHFPSSSLLYSSLPPSLPAFLPPFLPAFLPSFFYLLNMKFGEYMTLNMNVLAFSLFGGICELSDFFNAGSVLHLKML